MPSSADLTRAIAQATTDIVADVARSDDPAVTVLIDGRSGSGKTTLAQLVAEAWPFGDGCEVISLDSLYAGWDGLSAGVDALVADVLAPRANGVTARWREWDWYRGGRGAEHLTEPGRGLIVEGAGALRADTQRFARVRVWLDADESARRERALARDGDAYIPHWDRWKRQEDDHVRDNAPAERATLRFEVP